MTQSFIAHTIQEYQHEILQAKLDLKQARNMWVLKPTKSRKAIMEECNYRLCLLEQFMETCLEVRCLNNV